MAACGGWSKVTGLKVSCLPEMAGGFFMDSFELLDEGRAAVLPTTLLWTRELVFLLLEPVTSDFDWATSF